MRRPLLKAFRILKLNSSFSGQCKFDAQTYVNANEYYRADEKLIRHGPQVSEGRPWSFGMRIGLVIGFLLQLPPLVLILRSLGARIRLGNTRHKRRLFSVLRYLRADDGGSKEVRGVDSFVLLIGDMSEGDVKHFRFPYARPFSEKFFAWETRRVACFPLFSSVEEKASSVGRFLLYVATGKAEQIKGLELRKIFEEDSVSSLDGGVRVDSAERFSSRMLLEKVSPSFFY